MRSAVILLTAVVVVAAEAPYHLPRPAPLSPPFGYPVGPAPPPPPAPFPQLPQPRPVPQPFVPHPHPGSPPSHGYHYQQPSFRPVFIHPAPLPAPNPSPVYHPPPQAQLPAPHLQPQPIPISYPQPQPVNYPQPQLPINYPRPQPIPIPQPTYGLPQSQPQFPPQLLPSFFYNVPQVQVAPIPSISNPTFSQAHSFAYQQPIPQPQFAAPLPLQSQPLTSNAVTSYQADSNQYATAQAATHGEALDETVVSHVQNIIKDSEHSSAKEAGYLSLVSGVSLENAKPSIELSSFVYNSPQGDAGLIDVRSSSTNAAQSSSVARAAGISSSYEVPTISVFSGQSSDSGASLGILPKNEPGSSYGLPN